jgi:hypothetical protein
MSGGHTHLATTGGAQAHASSASNSGFNKDNWSTKAQSSSRLHKKDKSKSKPSKASLIQKDVDLDLLGIGAQFSRYAYSIFAFSLLACL